MIAPDIVVTAAGRFAEDSAACLAAAIRDAVRLRGACRLGLAGGGTPAPVYRALARVGDVPWSAVDLFWGDERAVPPEDEGSNYAMASAALIDLLPESPRHVHRVRGELGAEPAARAYAEVLGDEPLDVLLLGMGGDGHTASLFPDTQLGAATAHGPRVIATTSPKPPHPRVSLSVGAINEARAVYFLVAGAGKAARLAEVRDQIEAGTPTLPAAYVQPTTKQLVWLVDPDAASQL